MGIKSTLDKCQGYKCALSREQPIHKPSIAFLSCKQYTSFVEQLVIKKGVIKMSESNEDTKKMEARIAKLDEQQKQLKAKKGSYVTGLVSKHAKLGLSD